MTDGSDSAFARLTVFGDDEDRPGNLATYEDGAAGLTKREWIATTLYAGMLAYGNGRVQDAVYNADRLIEILNKENPYE